MKKKQIIEKKLGIPGNYQYTAIRSKNIIQSNWHNNKLEILANIIKTTGAKNVLDLGTGSGNFELRFAGKLIKITGVDYNPEAIKFLRRKLKQRKINNVKLITADLRKITKRDIVDKYDLVVMVDVIEHLKMPDAEKLIFKIKSFLKPGGYVCMITPNYKSPWGLIEKMIDIFGVVPHLEDGQHLSKFHFTNMRKLFSKAGYKNIDLKSFNFLFFLPVSKSISAKLSLLEMSLKLSFGNLLVIVAQNL